MLKATLSTKGSHTLLAYDSKDYPFKWYQSVVNNKQDPKLPPIEIDITFDGTDTLLDKTVMKIRNK